MEGGRFKGIFPALITPFDCEGEVKLEALRGVVRFHIEKGVNGFFVCGSAGEGPLMSISQRRLVAETVIDEASGDVSIIVHVGTTNTKETVELAKHAEKNGADAVGVVSPYYFKPDLEGLIQHYRLVSESISIPVFVYNMPLRTGFNVTSEIVNRLFELPNVMGVKDSSRNLIQIREIIETAPKGITVINGSDNLIFAALTIGVHGQISGTANVAPELFVELYKAFKDGDLDKALKLQADINAVIRALTGPPIAPLKAALELRGVSTGVPKSPLRPLRQDEISELKERLGALDLFW